MEISPQRTEALQALLRRWNIECPDISGKDLELFNHALTHSSFGEPSYERLEFLGDRVLNLIVAEYLYLKPGESTAGEMSKKMEVTNNENLGAFIGGNEIFRIGDIRTGGGTPPNSNIRADTFEAFVGALYLNQKLPAAREWVLRVLSMEIDDFPSANCIGKLQEFCQKKKFEMPYYSDPVKKGPDHEPTFTLEVRAADVKVSGTGKRVGIARQDAAKKALTQLGVIAKKDC
jgi:ribonuclease-3